MSKESDRLNRIADVNRRLGEPTDWTGNLCDRCGAITVCASCEQLENRIATLRARVATLEADYENAPGYDERTLRARVAELEGPGYDFGACVLQVREIDRLRAEVERLRAALERISDAEPCQRVHRFTYCAGCIARAALSPQDKVTP